MDSLWIGVNKGMFFFIFFLFTGILCLDSIFVSFFVFIYVEKCMLSLLSDLIFTNTCGIYLLKERVSATAIAGSKFIDQLINCR